MSKIEIAKLMELVLKLSTESNEVPKKDLQQTYNRVGGVNLPQLKKVLTQQFFFTDATRAFYDFAKVQVYNILYCGGNDAVKANFFFKLVQSSQSGCINNGSTKLLKALEYMTIITCIVMSEAMLKEEDEFSDEDDEAQFEELHRLYTTNHLVIKEFALHINETLLFKAAAGARRGPKYLTLEDFQALMEKGQLNFTLVRASEMRQRFTEFVMANQSLALEEPALSLIQSDGFGYNDSVVMRQQGYRRNERLVPLHPGGGQGSKQGRSKNGNQGARSRKDMHDTSMQSLLSQKDQMGSARASQRMKKGLRTAASARGSHS